MAIEINPDEEFHVVLGGVVTTLSLNALDAAYQGDAIQDGTLIWQQGFDEWMRLDALLEALANQDSEPEEIEATIEEDVYYVMVAPEEVKKMSLDLLSDAYRLDVIDEETLVWQPGYTEWIPLKMLLGSEEPVPHYSLAPSLAPVAPSAPSHAYRSQAPVAPSSAYTAVAPSAPSSLYPSSASVGPSSAYPSQAPVAPRSVYALQPSSAYPGQVPSSGYSLAPMADIPLPRAIPRASPWFRRSLVAISTFAFVFILHRNGATQSLAEGLEKTEDLQNFEAKFGAPTYRTPHELARWLLEVQETYKLSDLSETEALPGEKKADEPGVDEQDKPASIESAAALAEEKTASEKSTQDSPQAEGKAANFGAALSGKKAEPQAAKPRKQTARPQKERKVKSSGLAYDPMNGSL